MKIDSRLLLVAFPHQDLAFKRATICSALKVCSKDKQSKKLRVFVKNAFVFRYLKPKRQSWCFNPPDPHDYVRIGSTLLSL